MLIASNHCYPGNFYIPNTTIKAAPVEYIEPERKIVRMNVSAYTIDSDECGRDDGLTASGVIGTPFYTCAADDLPFGTKLNINGTIWVVEDRFGGGYSDRIDLLMETKDQCYEFGRQYIDVEILE